MTGLGGLASVGQLSAGALVAIIVLLILTGWLIPRWVLRRMEADRDYWRATADTQQKISTEQGMTLEKLTAATEKLAANDEAILHVVQEIQRAATGGSA